MRYHRQQRCVPLRNRKRRPPLYATSPATSCRSIQEFREFREFSGTSCRLVPRLRTGAFSRSPSIEGLLQLNPQISRHHDPRKFTLDHLLFTFRAVFYCVTPCKSTPIMNRGLREVTATATERTKCMLSSRASFACYSSRSSRYHRLCRPSNPAAPGRCCSPIPFFSRPIINPGKPGTPFP
jgi:hypothetical protein